MAGFTHRKVTELKVMVPTATVTATHHIYTPRKEYGHYKEEQKCYTGTGGLSYSCWGTRNFEYSPILCMQPKALGIEEKLHYFHFLHEPSDYINDFFN